MITLRNVLLSINGACLTLLLYEHVKGNEGLEWLPAAITIYLVVDFAYLSLTYPRRRLSEYFALLKYGEARRD
jgi:hypothetical protein